MQTFRIYERYKILDVKHISRIVEIIVAVNTTTVFQAQFSSHHSRREEEKLLLNLISKSILIRL